MNNERKNFVTPARLAANRRNAQKSTGPRTAAGKRRVALNRRSRGLIPEELERQLVARGEDPREFRRLHRALIAIFHPAIGVGVIGFCPAGILKNARGPAIEWIAAGQARSLERLFQL